MFVKETESDMKIPEYSAGVRIRRGDCKWRGRARISDRDGHILETWR